MTMIITIFFNYQGKKNVDLFLISLLRNTMIKSKRQVTDQEKIQYNIYKRPRIRINSTQRKLGKSIIKTNNPTGSGQRLKTIHKKQTKIFNKT